MSIYGQIITFHQVELAMKNFLQRWLPTYLAEMERQTGRTPGSLPRPVAWSNTTEFTKFPEENLPLVVIVCPSITGTPVKEGNGSYRVAYPVGVAVVVKAGGSRPKESVRALAGIYSAAVRAAVLQHRGLDGFAITTNWIDERSDDIPVDARRSLGSGQNVFEVEVRDVVSAHMGTSEPDPPADPLEDPGDWPIATDVAFEIEKEELA